MRKCKIGEIAELCLGKMLDREKNKGEYEPYLANANVQWGRFELNDLPLMKFEEKEQERYGLKYGDIVMCEGGEPGRCAIWRNEVPNMKIQKALHRIRVTDDSVDYRYLYYWFLIAGRQDLLKGNFIETTIKHLTGERLKEIEIELPSHSSQKKIGVLLENIDAKIESNRKGINVLESMAKTLYDYWFVQFDFPDANGRPYKTSGGKMEWNETLSREIPKGWESDLAGVLIKNITNGLNPRKNFKLNVGGNIDYLTVKNLTKSGLIDWSNCDKITDDDKKIVSKRSDLRRGDILLASISPLGRCYYITETPSTWDINESVFSVRSNSEKCTSEYLYSFLTSELFIKQLENNSTGSIFKGIRVEALKLMPIVVPPIKVIERYSRIVKKYYYAKEKLANENIRLAQLRDYLLPMLMNGQVTFRQ